MGDSRHMWQMSRRERRGTVVVLVVVALLLGAMAALRSCRNDTVSATTAIQHFKQEVDSANTAQQPSKPAAQKQPKPAKTKPERSRKRHHQPSPSRAPRPVDPVPQFRSM